MPKTSHDSLVGGLPEQARRWSGVALGMFLALVAAYWVGTENRFPLLVLAVLIAQLAVTVLMRDRAWALIPLCWLFSGNILLLPIPFSVRDISIMSAAVAGLCYRIVAGKSLSARWSLLDGLVAVNVLWLVVTYMVHPVGFRAFGAETVGGRPYVNIAMGALAFWVLSRLPSSDKIFKQVPLIVLCGAALLTGLNVVGYVFPGAVPLLYNFYSALDLDMYQGAATVSVQEFSRYKGLSYLGFSLLLVICAYYPPRELLRVYRWPFYLLVLSVVMILLSGFRNVLLWSVAAIAIACLLHRSWREMFMAGLVGLLLLVAIAFGQGRLYQLPGSIQRTLSFLPGQWNEHVKNEAAGSTEWRFQLWQTVISEGAIKNWWVGDGFGMSQEDLMSRGIGYTEWALLSGSYHNGPLSAVRYAGVAGLGLLYVLMITLAIQSVRCANRCRGGPLFPVVVFLAMQTVWAPIHYTFVFGGYASQLPLQFFMAGLVQTLVRLPEITPPAPPPTIPPVVARRPVRVR